MPVINNEDFLLEVEDPAAPATYVPVSDMNTYSRNSSRDASTHPVFGRPLPYSVPGSRAQTFSCAGYLNTDDEGQEILRTAERDNTPVRIRIVFSGTSAAPNGFSQQVNVTSFSHDASADGGLQEHGFEFAAAAAAVQLGTGPIV